MKEKVRRLYKSALGNKLTDLMFQTGMIEGSLEGVEMESRSVGDEFDGAQAMLASYVDSRVGTILTKDINMVLSAIRRLENGGFGFCETCRGEIHENRLEAIPWAVECIGCAEKGEMGIIHLTPEIDAPPPIRIAIEN